MTRINSLQFSSIIIMIIMAPLLGTGFSSIIRTASIDSYISVVISFIIGLILIKLFLLIFNYEPDLPLNKKINKLLGDKIGLIINLILSIIVIIIGIEAMFSFTGFITSQFLPETSNLLIGIVFSILLILINTKGIEVISRTSLILLTTNILIYVITLLGLLNNFDFSNIKPFLEYGINRPIYGSIYIMSFNILPLFLLLMIPKNSIVNNYKFKKYLFISYGIGMILIFITVLSILCTLGIQLTSLYQYPEYIILKNISLFMFIDRIENVLTIHWIFNTFIYLSIIVFFLSNMVKSYNQNVISISSITILILIISQTVFENDTIFNNFTYKYSLISRSILFIVIFTIGVIILYKKGNNLEKQ